METKAEQLTSWLKPQCFTSVRTEPVLGQTQVFTLHGLPKKCVFVYISIQARKCRHKKLSGTHGWIRIPPVILQIMRFGVKVGRVITHCGLSHALLPVNTRGRCSFGPLEPQAVLHTPLLRPKPQIHSWFLFSSPDKSNPSARPSGLIHSTPRTHSIYPSLLFTSTLSTLPPPLPCHTVTDFQHISPSCAPPFSSPESTRLSAETQVTSNFKPFNGFPLCSGIDLNSLRDLLGPAWPGSFPTLWLHLLPLKGTKLVPS